MDKEEKKTKPTFKNSDERLKYIMDDDNWETLQVSRLTDCYERPVFRLERLKGAPFMRLILLQPIGYLRMLEPVAHYFEVDGAECGNYVVSKNDYDMNPMAVIQRLKGLGI